MTDQTPEQQLAALRRKMAAVAADQPSPEQLAEWSAADKEMARRINTARPGVSAHHAFLTLDTLRAIQRYDAAGEEPEPNPPIVGLAAPICPEHQPGAECPCPPSCYCCQPEPAPAATQAADERLRVAEFTASHWHQAVINADNIPAAHAIACIRSALKGETRPEQLGLDDAVHDAFRATLDGPGPEDTDTTPAACTCGGPFTTTTLPSGTTYEEHRVYCAVMAVDDELEPEPDPQPVSDEFLQQVAGAKARETGNLTGWYEVMDGAVGAPCGNPEPHAPHRGFAPGPICPGKQAEPEPQATACDAYQPPATAADSGLCARCGMYDYRHRPDTPPLSPADEDDAASGYEDMLQRVQSSGPRRKGRIDPARKAAAARRTAIENAVWSADAGLHQDDVDRIADAVVATLSTAAPAATEATETDVAPAGMRARYETAIRGRFPQTPDGHLAEVLDAIDEVRDQEMQRAGQQRDQYAATLREVLAYADRLDTLAQATISATDRELYAAIARDLRKRATIDQPQEQQ